MNVEEVYSESRELQAGDHVKSDDQPKGDDNDDNQPKGSDEQSDQMKIGSLFDPNQVRINAGFIPGYFKTINRHNPLFAVSKALRAISIYVMVEDLKMEIAKYNQRIKRQIIDLAHARKRINQLRFMEERMRNIPRSRIAQRAKLIEAMREEKYIKQKFFYNQERLMEKKEKMFNLLGEMKKL